MSCPAQSGIRWKFSRNHPKELAAWKKASVEFAATKVVTNVDPAVSDLLTAERQEALEALLSLLV